MFDYNTTVSDIELVPENARGLYTANEDGTSFTLDGDLAKRLDTSKLKGALDKERNLNRQNGTTLEGWKGLGFETVEEAQAAIEEMKNLQATGAEGKADFDKWKLEAEAKMQKIIEGKDGEVSAANATVCSYLIDSQAAGILADKASGLAGSAELIMPHINNEAEAVKGEDGKHVVRIKDLDAPGSYRSNGEGGFMNLQELLTEMKGRPNLARAFDAEAKQGIQSKPNQKPGALRKNTGDMSANQKIAAGMEARKRR